MHCYLSVQKLGTELKPVKLKNSGRSWKNFTLVIYYSKVVATRKNTYNWYINRVVNFKRKVFIRLITAIPWYFHLQFFVSYFTISWVCAKQILLALLFVIFSMTWNKRLMSSVTRLGEISPLWHTVKELGPF